ncbi:MAG: type II secretion system F family protein [Candidatus Micrarchaeota archaeon]|nr:type II secretion system F family protein [Candidatus Micrarchaeota archaeon]
MDWEIYLKPLDVTPMQFLIKYVIPLSLGAFVVGLIVSGMLFFLIPDVDLFLLFIIPIMVSLMGLIVAIAYPKIVASQQKSDIENYIHFFVTRIGTLATAGIPPAQLFKIMSTKKEYKTIADKCKSIYMRFAVWHIPLGNSFKIEARYSPSEIFADFLERFASALEAGTSTEEFLRVEQKNVMADYVVNYKNALYQVDVVKEMFISIVIGLVFLMAFAILIPYLTCMEPEILIAGAVFFFVVVELLLAYYLKAIIPKDELIYEKRLDIENKNLIFPYFAYAFVISIFLPIIIFFFFKMIPVPLVAAIAVTPFIYPANYINKIEKNIKRGDLFFSEFIIAFGHTIHARGGAIKSSLKTMTFHDFGPLTEPVRNVFERMKLRSDNERPWHMFYIETGSRLIANFMEVFTETLTLGGKPKETCELINENFLRMMEVRKLRYNTSGTFRGILYGLHAGIVFTAYASAEVVLKLGNMFSAFSFDMGTQSSLASIICIPTVESMKFSNTALVVMMLMNALVFSISLKIVDGGHFVSGLSDFVLMMWIGAITAIVTGIGISMLVGV